METKEIPAAPETGRDPASAPARRSRALRALALAAALLLALAIGFLMGRGVGDPERPGRSGEPAADRTGAGDSTDAQAWLRAELEELCPGKALVPRYLPEGLVPHMKHHTIIRLDEEREQEDVSVTYLWPGQQAELQLVYMRGHTAQHFPKDPGDPEIYIVGGVEHYISTNTESYLAVWGDEDLTCAIMGVPSREELVKMLDSIYPEP